MLALRHDRADREGRRSGLGFGIADRKIADSQRSGEIAFQQQRRSLQRRRNIVETKVAAVARQQFRDVEIHAQQIANGVGIFRAIETMQNIAARIVLCLPQRCRGW